ncbi:MAG: hypothetical protein R2867_36155 [Caldilineaceae bacterium]
MLSLAKRHVAYGVQGAHYATVGAALLETWPPGWATTSRRQSRKHGVPSMGR